MYTIPISFANKEFQTIYEIWFDNYRASLTFNDWMSKNYVTIEYELIDRRMSSLTFKDKQSHLAFLLKNS